MQINAIKMTHESNEMINALKHVYSHLFMCNNLATIYFRSIRVAQGQTRSRWQPQHEPGLIRDDIHGMRSGRTHYACWSRHEAQEEGPPYCCGLAMKRKRKDRRIVAGLPRQAQHDPGADVSYAFLVLTADRTKHTIGASAILGCTFISEYEDIKRIHDMLVEQNELNGWHIALHVGAASGDFIHRSLTPSYNGTLDCLMSSRSTSVDTSSDLEAVAQYATVWLRRLPNHGNNMENAVSYVKLWWTLISSISSTRRTCRWWLSRSRTRLLTRVSTSSRAVTIMRVVAKQNSSCQTAKMLVQDILHAVAALEQHPRMQHVSLPRQCCRAPDAGVVNIKHTKLASNKIGNGATSFRSTRCVDGPLGSRNTSNIHSLQLQRYRFFGGRKDFNVKMFDLKQARLPKRC
ncbi:Pyridoxal phosphate-dependent decarboxylase [Phytophthora cactorum]|nr:Pyridoxal phosphate-dependent decarboxylase [Phytophthora cactorum]